jgi:hypothetical protein
VKCAGDPACPFPVVMGEDRCREHLADLRLPLTLHETSSGGGVRNYADSWGLRISGDRLGWTSKRGRPKMTEEERKAKYSNTYCRALLESGVRCNAPIPTDERVCDGCKERLLPAKDKTPGP